ncbi:Flp pilus assembly protein CpaB [Guptibacillus algicola]|uniref:Flp pilus assembly protein CpaB n=1 Tax=Guptibacillus algicola TaxID=225844 RepID=UPI001CD44797|nr:Flp pilus assembly protein CpaB [Alkalihalobacillus algicola]MCA0987533.1 Flp pilus assembly protein CpaB [Alkalihalobacillus algicola]
MKTKRIWMWSLVFGVIATGIVYVALFSNMAIVTSTGSDSNTEDVPEVEEVVEAAPTVIEREMSNEMLEVSEGKRAISLKVTLEQGVSGYVVPGSFVDVVAFETTVDEEKKQELRTAKVVLQNVKVLGSGKASDAGEESLLYETVTLEVDPKQGVQISLASTDANGFYLMLRNEEDKAIEKAELKESRQVVEGVVSK